MVRLSLSLFCVTHTHTHTHTLSIVRSTASPSVGSLLVKGEFLDVKGREGGDGCKGEF